MPFCQNCGQNNDASVKFCTSCGASLAGAQTAVPPVVPAPPVPVIESAVPAFARPESKLPKGSGGKAPYLVLIGLLAIGLIAFAVLYFTRPGSTGAGQPEIAALENNVTDLQAQLNTEKSTAAKANSDLSTANNKIASLQADLTAANANVAKLTADLAAPNTSTAKLTSDLAAANANVAKLTADLAAANASAAKATTDLAAANARVTTTQASLDKANADLAKSGTDLAAANAALKKVTAPKHFSSLAELTAWLAKDDTNTKYASSDALSRAYILQVRALRDGYIITANTVAGSPGQSASGDSALVGNNIYVIDPSTDYVLLYYPNVMPYPPLQPLPPE